jgi:hypothetical protein
MNTNRDLRWTVFLGRPALGAVDVLLHEGKCATRSVGQLAQFAVVLLADVAEDAAEPERSVATRELVPAALKPMAER